MIKHSFLDTNLLYYNNQLDTKGLSFFMNMQVILEIFQKTLSFFKSILRGLKFYRGKINLFFPAFGSFNSLDPFF